MHETYPDGTYVLQVRSIKVVEPTDMHRRRLVIKSLVLAGMKVTLGREFKHAYYLNCALSAPLLHAFLDAVGVAPDADYAPAVGRAYEVDIKCDAAAELGAPVHLIDVSGARRVTGLVGAAPPADTAIFDAAERVCADPVCADVKVNRSIAPKRANDGAYVVTLQLRLQRKDIGS